MSFQLSKSFATSVIQEIIHMGETSVLRDSLWHF